jgi:beta-galactosidase
MTASTNRRPLLISGERRILHGGDYNPDQWLDEPRILEEDDRLMALSGCQTFAVGIFAWMRLEPSEGRYEFDWLDRTFETMDKAGRRVILATPSGAKPAWMSRKYPEICRVNRQGLREPHGGRHNHCWQSPVYRDKVRAINERLAERYGTRVGMWHISNEYSGECYCEKCLARWHGFLEEKYGSLKDLNEAWWTSFWSHTFTSFAQIDPRDLSVDGMKLDWFRFSTEQCVDFMRWEISALRKYSDVPTTTNFMGTFSGFDYSRMAEVIDLISDDQYPTYNPDEPYLEERVLGISMKDDLHRSFKLDRPWMLMESCPDAPQWKNPVRLKRPGLHQAEMLQAIGHGAEGTCYFQWRKGRGGSEKLHGAVVDHVGHEHTRVFRTVQSLSTVYEKIADVVGSVVESDVALLFDWDVRNCFEGTEGVRCQDSAYEKTCLSHYAPLAKNGVSVDVLGTERDFSKYKLVIAPQLWLLRPGLAARIRAFVEAGGTFVGTYYTGVVEESGRCFGGGWPGDGLMDVFGLWNEETDWLPDGITRLVTATEAGRAVGLDETYDARNVCALVHPQGAEVLLKYAEDFFASLPALTVHRLGAGQAYYHATALGPDFLEAFYGTLIVRLGLRRALDCRLPAGVHVQRRVGRDGEFVFVQNFSSAEQTVPLPGAGYVDRLSGTRLNGPWVVGPWASTVLFRATEARSS